MGGSTHLSCSDISVAFAIIIAIAIACNCHPSAGTGSALPCVTGLLSLPIQRESSLNASGRWPPASRGILAVAIGLSTATAPCTVTAVTCPDNYR